MKLSRFTSKGWLPTNIVELAELIGCSSQNAAAEHVKALKKKVTSSIAPGAAGALPSSKQNWMLIR
jgi:SOS-response transcriptional repressor LexA